METAPVSQDVARGEGEGACARGSASHGTCRVETGRRGAAAGKGDKILYFDISEYTT
jgi:hypothetical protein